MDPIGLWDFIGLQSIAIALAAVCGLGGGLAGWKLPIRLLHWLSARPWLLAAPALLASALVLMRGGVPMPQVHDEFSHRLAADTFLHGRLANPTPAAWQHFETFHVNLVPTYVSMYPPGWGAVLAAFILLTGQAYCAVVALGIAFGLCTWWAARAWLPRHWAFAAASFGALFAAGGYWLNSYWGGSLAATAGALLVGALPRLRGPHATRAAAIASVAAGVLLFTRPYEGAALLGASAILAAGPVWKSPIRWRILGIACFVVACFVGWIATYNFRTTGDPLRSAYQLNYDTYHQRKLFVFGHDREPAPGYHHETMQWLYTTALDMEPFSRNWLEVCALPTLSFYSPGLLLLLVAVSPLCIRNRRYRHLLLLVGAVSVACLLTVWIRPHYFAPAAGALAILGAAALRRISAQSPAGAAALFLALAGTMAAHGAQRLWDSSQIPNWLDQRNKIATRLTTTPGKHLVIVRYGILHNPNYEWVFNSADFTAANPLLWARSLGEVADQQLAAAYPDRQVWIVEPDVSAELHPLVRGLGQGR